MREYVESFDNSVAEELAFEEKKITCATEAHAHMLKLGKYSVYLLCVGVY